MADRDLFPRINNELTPDRGSRTGARIGGFLLGVNLGVFVLIALVVATYGD